MTTREIADHLGISHQRVEQIIDRAIKWTTLDSKVGENRDKSFIINDSQLSTLFFFFVSTVF